MSQTYIKRSLEPILKKAAAEFMQFMSINDYRTFIIADDRERNGEVIQLLSEMKNVSVAIKRLARAVWGRAAISI